MFKKDKTNRGWSIFWFDDDYGEKCSLQESSAVEPHIWLGVHEPYHKVLCSEAHMVGINPPDTVGWCDYPIPKEVSVYSRMHLTRKQAKELGKQLIKFARKGRLK